jgi:hypothetical protein
MCCFRALIFMMSWRPLALVCGRDERKNSSNSGIYIWKGKGWERRRIADENVTESRINKGMRRRGARAGTESTWIGEAGREWEGLGAGAESTWMGRQVGSKGPRAQTVCVLRGGIVNLALGSTWLWGWGRADWAWGEKEREREWGEE